MSVHPRISLFAVAVSFVALASHTTQSDSSAAFAQQRNQTNLDFMRERAQVKTLGLRIDALRQRLAVVVARSDHAGAREHVLLSRDPPPPQRSQTSITSRASDEGAENETVRRNPSTLRHRDRALTSADVEALRSRLDAVEQTARALGERVNRPDFGAGLRALEHDLAQIEAAISNFE